MSTKTNGFAAIGQSLLSMGESIISGNPVPSKPKKKTHKKKNNKAKGSTETTNHQLLFGPNTQLADDFDDWQSQAKPKKSKAKMNCGSVNVSLAPATEIVASSTSIPTSSCKTDNDMHNGSESALKPYLKKRNVDKAVKKETSMPPTQQEQTRKDPVVVKSPTVNPCTQPVSVNSTNLQINQFPQKKSEVPLCQDLTYLFDYMLHLEHSLANGCGSAAVEAVRSEHPRLTFHEPVPSPSFQISQLSEDHKATQLSELKIALLVAKGELSMYKKRQQTQSQQPFVELKKPEVVMKKMKVASTQCALIDQSSQQKEHSVPLPTQPPSSAQSTIEKSILDQIRTLTFEKTTIEQRYAITTRECEDLKKDLSRLKAECKKIKTKTAKETKELVKKECDALVEALRNEVTEKDAQITARSAESDSLRVQFELLQAEVSQLKQSEQVASTQFRELEVTLKDAIAQRDGLLLEKSELTKTLERVTSEIPWLKRSLSEKEDKLDQTENECSNLRTELEVIKHELEESSLARQAIAEELSIDREALKCLKNEVALLESDFSTKEEELTAARSELDQTKKDLAYKTSELISVQKEMETIQLQQQKHQKKGVLEIGASEDCRNCFVLSEKNAELKGALEKTRNDLLNLESHL